MQAIVDQAGTRSGQKSPFVEIADGHLIHVRDWGDGAPVVLLAGWGMASPSWGETMVALTDAGLRAVAYDRRGHGRSTDPGIVSYDLLADDLAAVLEQRDLTNVTIVAHSGAGGEAIRYITRHGADRVARIVLLGATGPRMIGGEDGASGLTREMADAAVGRIRSDLPAWLDESIHPFAPQADQRTLEWLATAMLDTSRRILVDFQRAILDADFTEEARSLPVPVTIIHGDLDASAPIDLTARRYVALIPEAELVIYEGVAHGVMTTHGYRLASDIVARVKQ